LMRPISRSTTPAYFGKVIAPLSFEDPLAFSGKFTLLQASATEGWTNSSDIFIGFFNSEKQGWRPPNFLGFHLYGHRESLQYHLATLALGYGTAAWESEGNPWDRTIYPDGTSHNFELVYDPAAGNGEISFTWDGEPILTLKVEDFHREHGAVFNRFGIFNNQTPGNQRNHM
jgi:hypothetical protein